MTRVLKDWRHGNMARVKAMAANGGTQRRIVEMPQAAVLEPLMHRRILSSKPLVSSCTCDMCSRLSKANSLRE